MELNCMRLDETLRQKNNFKNTYNLLHFNTSEIL